MTVLEKLFIYLLVALGDRAWALIDRELRIKIQIELETGKLNTAMSGLRLTLRTMAEDMNKPGYKLSLKEKNELLADSGRSVINELRKRNTSR